MDDEKQAQERELDEQETDQLTGGSKLDVTLDVNLDQPQPC